MSDTDKKTDEEKMDETLKRMLNTPPDPKGGGDKPNPKPKKQGAGNGD